MEQNLRVGGVQGTMAHFNLTVRLKRKGPMDIRFKSVMEISPLDIRVVCEKNAPDMAMRFNCLLRQLTQIMVTLMQSYIPDTRAL